MKTSGSKKGACWLVLGFLAQVFCFLDGSQPAWAHSHAGPDSKADPVIIVDGRAGAFYHLVGEELQGYIAKLTGVWPEILEPGQVDQQAQKQVLILVGGPEANPLVREAVTAGQVSFQGLKPEGFVLKSVRVKRHPALVIGGNEEAGTMYGAYDWLERQGIVFQLTGDILPPAQTKSLSVEGLNVRAETPFPRRGYCVWTDFGHLAIWSLNDWKSFIDQMAKLKLNYLQFYWYVPSPYLSYSYKGEKNFLGDITGADSGYTMWQHANLGSYKVADIKIGQEVFAKFGKRYMAPDVLQGVKDPDQAAAEAQDLYHEIIRYAKSRKINVWLGIDAAVLPANLARYCRRTGPVPFEPILGTYVSPTDPTTEAIEANRMKALIQTYPDAQGYFLFLSEGYPRYQDPEDLKLIESMRSKFERTTQFIKQFRTWGGYHTPDQAMQSLIGQTYIIQKMLEAGKRFKPSAQIGIGGIGHGFVFPILHDLFPKDVPFTDMEGGGVWTEKGVPMEEYGGMGDRERTIIPRSDDDANQLEIQFNVNLFYKDRVLEGAVKNSMAGLAMQGYRPRGSEWDTKFLAEGAWSPHMTPDEFYHDYSRRVFGPKAAGEMVKAFHILELKEAFEGYHYFGPLDFPCCSPPDEISIAKWWADAPDPYAGPAQTQAEAEHWDHFIQESRKRMEQFRAKIDLSQQALDHLAVAEALAAPAGQYQIRYIENRTNAHMLHLKTLITLMQGYIEMDSAFRVDRLKDRRDFLEHLDHSLLKFQDAKVSARATARKWVELVDYPSDLEVLRRINVFMVTGTELIGDFVQNIINFHCGKPYLKPVAWQKIFTSYKYWGTMGWD